MDKQDVRITAKGKAAKVFAMFIIGKWYLIHWTNVRIQRLPKAVRWNAWLAGCTSNCLWIEHEPGRPKTVNKLWNHFLHMIVERDIQNALRVGWNF